MSAAANLLAALWLNNTEEERVRVEVIKSSVEVKRNGIQVQVLSTFVFLVVIWVNWRNCQLPIGKCSCFDGNVAMKPEIERILSGTYGGHVFNCVVCPGVGLSCFIDYAGQLPACPALAM